MPRPRHHRTLFSLEPVNDQAKEVLADQINKSFVSTLDDGRLALGIGHIRSKRGAGTLATLGRGNTDIWIENPSISRMQCSFEMDLDSRIVMLYDKSSNSSTQVLGENATPFEYGRDRKVAVLPSIDTMIGMGGEGRDLILFRLVWHQNHIDTMKKVNDLVDLASAQEDNPRLAQTIDAADAVGANQRVTRIHASGTQRLPIRYTELGDLGRGRYGNVRKAVNMDTGKLMAVKTLQRYVNDTNQQLDLGRQSGYYALKQEVENLANLHHVSKALNSLKPN